MSGLCPLPPSVPGLGETNGRDRSVSSGLVETNGRDRRVSSGLGGTNDRDRSVSSSSLTKSDNSDVSPRLIQHNTPSSARTSRESRQDNPRHISNSVVIRTKILYIQLNISYQLLNVVYKLLNRLYKLLKCFTNYGKTNYANTRPTVKQT